MVTPTLDAEHDGALSGWIGGALRGWSAASEFCGLSRAQIKSLVDADLVRCFPIGERENIQFSRLDLARVLAEKHSEYALAKQEAKTGAGART